MPTTTQHTNWNERTGKCLFYAWKTARKDRNLRIYVGYASQVPVWETRVAHAWCVAHDGQVIDPTWQYGGAFYLGHEIAVEDAAPARNRWSTDPTPLIDHELLPLTGSEADMYPAP